MSEMESQQDSGCFSFLSSPAKSIFDSPNSEKSPTSPFLTNRSFVEYEFYRSQRKHVDILSQLHDHNAYHLLEDVFRRLNDRDLQHCSQVCQRWKLILQEYSHRRQKHTVKRTLFHQSVPSPISISTSTKETKLFSTPLQTIINRSSPKRSMNETFENLSSQYGYLKYLHGPTRTKRCPICAFVSIVDINDQHGVCTNPLCGNSFCQWCSGPYHPSSPCKISTGPIKSPWRKRPRISPIFSGKTRSNLRRLLLN